MLNDLEKKYLPIIKQLDQEIEDYLDLQNELLGRRLPNEIIIQNFKFSDLMLLDKNNNQAADKIKREILNETKYAQPAILLHSYLNFLKFCEENKPSSSDTLNIYHNSLNENKALSNQINNNIYFFGASLGEIISLAIAGSLNIQKAMILLYNRGKFMQESCPKGTGSMLNIVGDVNLTIPAFERFINEKLKSKKYYSENIDSDVNNKNYEINISSVMNKRLIVISGRTELIEDCARYMKDCGFASRKLIVSAAFHSNLMLEGSEKFREFLFDKQNQINFRFPKFDILSTINPEFIYQRKEAIDISESEFDLKVKNLLVDQFVKKVDILGCINKYKDLNSQNGIVNYEIYDIIKRKKFDLDEFI